MNLSFPLFRLSASVRSRLVLLVVLLLWLSAQPAFAQTSHSAEPGVEGVMKTMLAAIQNNSLSEFTRAGDSAFQSGMTQETLDSVRQVLGSRLRQGYTTNLLAGLKQQGFMVYLWKLEFKDNGDDVLLTLAMKDGRVSGFWLR